jgi:hypothetical protein
LQVVHPDDPPPTRHDDDTETLVAALAGRIEADAELLAAALRDPDDSLDLAALVNLRTTLTAATRSVGEASRLVGALGSAWLTLHGNRGRAEVDGVAYKTDTTGSSSSLKVADKARLARAWFDDRLAPWLASSLGSETPGDEADTTARLWLSLVVEKLGAAFTLDPKATVLRDEWKLDAAAYETPSTGAGPTPTFVKVPDPRTKEKP